MSKSAIKLKPNIYQIGILLLLAVGLYAVVPQLGDFKHAPTIIRSANIQYVLIAIGFTAGTYFAAAGTYVFLAFQKLDLWTTTLVQYGAMFINRWLPGGIGALGANFLYLRRFKHTEAQAASTVAVNNLMGFIGNSIVILIAFWFAPSGSLHVAKGNNSGSTLLKYVVVATIIIIILIIIFGRNRAKRLISDVGRQLYSYRKRPLSIAAALSTSMALTVCNVLALMFCLFALGIHLPFVVVIVILSLGVGAGAATPTPGGIGGFEAGLVAGFVAYGVNQSTALAAALLYRLISYWLAMLFGGIALYEAHRQHLFSKSS